jgi:hypothetical protein
MDNENKVPPLGSVVTLRDGSSDKVKCGWYQKGHGGWVIMLESGKKIGLKDIRKREGDLKWM